MVIGHQTTPPERVPVQRVPRPLGIWGSALPKGGRPLKYFIGGLNSPSSGGSMTSSKDFVIDKIERWKKRLIAAFIFLSLAITLAEALVLKMGAFKELWHSTFK